MAEEFPDEQWLKVAASEAEQFDRPDWTSLYWDGWLALQSDRQFGAMGGQSPISYTAISAYADDHGLAGEDFVIFHRMVMAMDAEWIEHMARKTAKAT